MVWRLAGVGISPLLLHVRGRLWEALSCSFRCGLEMSKEALLDVVKCCDTGLLPAGRMSEQQKLSTISKMWASISFLEKPCDALKAVVALSFVGCLTMSSLAWMSWRG